MWSSWVKEKGTTQIMYIAKLKDGPKKLRKFSQWFGKGFRNGMMEGETMESDKKRIFEVEVFFSSQNIDFPFIWRDSWSFLSFFSILFLPLFSFYAPCLKDLGGLMILEEKNHFFKNFFSNEMVWTIYVWISAVDAYSEMELCTSIWLNHDHRDGGVVDISVVDAYSRVVVCMLIFLIHRSFLKNLQKSNGHIP
jgi:hypothetical protein